MSTDLDARAVIEALRSGVPSRAAAASLGSTQETIKSRFHQALERSASGEGCDPVVFEASFGEGKSHLLGYLSHLAHEAGWGAASIVISPGVPLGNPVVMLKQIAASTTVRGFTGKALRELAANLKTSSSDPWAEFHRRVLGSSLDERLKALVSLYEQMDHDPELRARILDDVEGAPMKKTEISKRLKECGQASAFNLKGGLKDAALAHQRIQLFAWMLQAMGQNGLVVLVDEVERTGTFTLKQRHAAYRELAWWKEIASTEGSRIVPVFAFSTGLMQTVMEKDAQHLSAGQTLASQEDPALRGNLFLRTEGERLHPVRLEQTEAIRYTVRDLYQRAYGISVQDLGPRRGEQTIRQSIRYWITCWDLARYHPGYHSNVTVAPVVGDEREVPDDQIDLDDGETDAF